MSDTHPAAPAPLAGPNKGGRPKIDPAAVRTLNLSVRLSPAEYAALRERADQLGMKPGQFLRQAGLTRRLPAAACAGRQPRRVRPSWGSWPTTSTSSPGAPTRASCPASPPRL